MSEEAPKSRRPAAVDTLVEDLRGGGDAEAGEFTLDRAVALEKLRKFQLTDPRAYVMELVQAAHLKGATWIDFELDTDDMWMRFDGSAFTAKDLEEVYSSVFRSDLDTGVRALRKLALGLNAALALKPRWIHMTSGAAENGGSLEIRRGRHDVTPDGGGGAKVTVGEKRVEAVTTIHVKARLKPELLRRFVRSLRRALPEERILRRRARFSTLDIQLNGRAIALGLAPPDAVADVRYEEEGLRVVCGLVPGYDPPKVYWVVSGALITTTELKGSGTEGFEAVVEANELHTDISQTSIVQDEIYFDALQKVDRGRNRLKMRSWAQKLQADKRYEEAQHKLETIYSRAASRYEVLHVVGERAFKVGYALILINIFAVALLPTLPEEHWRWVLLPLTLLVASFTAPSICGRLARSMLKRAKDRFERQFPRGNPARRLGRRALEKREDAWDGTLADAMQRRS